MSEKTSTIKQILGVRPYDGQHGRTFYFKIELDNGDIGDIGKKTETALKVGDSLTYTLEEGERGNKIKAVQNGGFNGGGYGGGTGKTAQRGGNESFALSYAKDLMCVVVEKSGDEMDAKKIADGTLWFADKFLHWMNEHKS